MKTAVVHCAHPRRDLNILRDAAGIIGKSGCVTLSRQEAKSTSPGSEAHVLLRDAAGILGKSGYITLSRL